MSQIRRSSYLMDDIHNGYFAISSRRIKWGYTNKVIKIRRASDNEEQVFYFEGDVLNKDNIDNFLNGSIGYITEWYDQLNPSNKLIQGDTARQPKYIKNAINNKAGMESVIPVTSLAKLINNINLNYSTSATFFCVVDIVGSQGTSGAQPFGTHDFFDANMFRPALINANYFIQGRDSLNNLFATPTITNITGKNIFIVICDGINKIKVYRNGALNPEINYTVTNGFLNTLRNITLGSFGGYLTEFIIYDTVLNIEKINFIRNNINSYYNIY